MGRCAAFLSSILIITAIVATVVQKYGHEYLEWTGASAREKKLIK